MVSDRKHCVVVTGEAIKCGAGSESHDWAPTAEKDRTNAFAVNDEPTPVKWALHDPKNGKGVSDIFSAQRRVNCDTDVPRTKPRTVPVFQSNGVYKSASEDETSKWIFENEDERPSTARWRFSANVVALGKNIRAIGVDAHN